MPITYRLTSVSETGFTVETWAITTLTHGHDHNHVTGRLGDSAGNVGSVVSRFPLYRRDGNGNEVTNPVAGRLGTLDVANTTGTTLYTTKDNPMDSNITKQNAKTCLLLMDSHTPNTIDFLWN